MKNLRIKTASVTLLFSLLVAGATAQPQGGGGRSQQGQGQQRPQREQKSPEKIAEILTDKMDQELELSDSQEKKILAINLKSAQDMDAKREAMAKERKEKSSQRKEGAEQQRPERPSREDMAAKMKEAKEAKAALETSIMKILNDDQKILYAKMLSKMDQKKGGPRGGNKMQQGRPQGKPQQGGNMQQGRPQGKQQQGGKMQQGEKPEGRPQGQRPQPKADEAKSE